MTLSALGTIAVVLILTWTLGGLALRLGGALVFWVGLLGLAVTGDPNGLLVAFLGALAWLGGQGHHALRHGATRSPVAGLIFAGAASLWRLFLRSVTGTQEKGTKR
jgi:hypothetical protein